MNLIPVDQIAILITGPSSIIMIGHEQPWRRLGFLIGLAGQPFWIHSSWVGNDWGIFFFSVFMVYVWGQGLCRNWERKEG